MSGLAYSSMRVGKRYRLITHGEQSEFALVAVVGRNDYKLRDLHTLEYYYMSDLTRFGKGDDFELREIQS